MTTGRAGAAAPRPPLHDDPGTDRRLADVVRFAEILAVGGAAGSGTVHTALRALDRRGAADPLVVAPGGDPGWFETARAAVTHRGVVLRRLHEAPREALGRVGDLAVPGALLAITADLDGADDAVTGLLRRIATVVRLPALAGSPERIPALVREVLAGLPEPASATRVSAEAWDRLLAWSWPGDLAELRNTVEQLARRAGGGVVRPGDLPEEVRAPHRACGLLEAAERDAVAEALRAAGGNRSRAALAFGIGRNTLYRKMREFGLS